MRASMPSPQVRLSLWIAFFLSATVLMAPAAASALAFSTEGSEVFAQVFDVQVRVEAPPDQALIDISAPIISLPTGGVTGSALSMLRSVVITTSDGGITSFGIVEATTIIDPLLVTGAPQAFTFALAMFQLHFDTGDTPMAVTFSGNVHVGGAQVTSPPPQNVIGGVLYGPLEGVDFGVPLEGVDLGVLLFSLSGPADLSFGFSNVVKPNRTIDFSVEAVSTFHDPVNLSTNFRDSQLDWTFTATPVPGPSPLLLLVGGLAAIVLIYGRTSIAKGRT